MKRLLGLGVSVVVCLLAIPAFAGDGARDQFADQVRRVAPVAPQAGELSWQAVALGIGPMATPPQYSIGITPRSLTLDFVDGAGAKLPAAKTGTFTVNLNRSLSTNTMVSVQCTPAGILACPSSVTVLPEAFSAKFDVTAQLAGAATVKVALPSSLGGDSTTASVMVNAMEITLSPPGLTVTVGDNALVTVAMNGARSEPTSVSVMSSAPSVANVPPAVTIEAGQASTTIGLTAVGVGSSTITAMLPASLGGNSASIPVNVQAASPSVFVTLPETITQVAGSGDVGSSSFSLTNVGNAPTTISLSQNGDFFIQSPSSVSLAPRESRTITLMGKPQTAAGSYEGASLLSGAGLRAGTRIPVRMLVSEQAITGTPRVIAVRTRVDVAAGAGMNPSGMIDFMNVGDGTAFGLVESSVLWLIPQGGPLVIEPKQTVTVPFLIDRTMRDDGGSVGSVIGALRFVYFLSTAGARVPFGTGVSTAAPVAVVDTSKPIVASSSLSPLAPNELALFIPGVGNVIGSGGKLFISDISLVNTGSGFALPDVQLFYTPTSGGTSKATLGSVGSNQSLALANIVSTVFNQSQQVGTLQVRAGTNLPNIALAANVFNANNPQGTFGTAIPVFRSDRAISSSQQLLVNGLRRDATSHTNFYVQEMSGVAGTMEIRFFDANGTQVGGSQSFPIGAFALLQLPSIVPEGAVRATVLNTSGARLSAYATPVDDLSGDTWALADWGQQFGVSTGATQVIPVAGAAPGANNTYFRTDVSLTNSSAASVSGTLTYYVRGGAPIAKPVTILAGRTLELKDVATVFFGAPNSLGFIIFTAAGGSPVSITSRTYTTVQGQQASFGTGVPTLPESFGIRVGESRLFGGLEDSATVTVQRGSPGTFRTNFALIETSGKAATVTASLLFYNGKQLAAGGANGSLTIQLAPYEYKQFNGMVGAVLGSSRETSYGDLHNVQIKFTVTSGEGRVVTFVTSTDNGTGDTVLRTE